jgi:hypothetical protein
MDDRHFLATNKNSWESKHRTPSTAQPASHASNGSWRDSITKRASERVADPAKLTGAGS